jgi:hypothetical protein
VGPHLPPASSPAHAVTPPPTPLPPASSPAQVLISDRRGCHPRQARRAEIGAPPTTDKREVPVRRAFRARRQRSEPQRRAHPRALRKLPRTDTGSKHATGLRSFRRCSPLRPSLRSTRTDARAACSHHRLRPRPTHQRAGPGEPAGRGAAHHRRGLRPPPDPAAQGRGPPLSTISQCGRGAPARPRPALAGADGHGPQQSSLSSSGASRASPSPSPPPPSCPPTPEIAPARGECGGGGSGGMGEGGEGDDGWEWLDGGELPLSAWLDTA